MKRIVLPALASLWLFAGVTLAQAYTALGCGLFTGNICLNMQVLAAQIRSDHPKEPVVVVDNTQASEIAAAIVKKRPPHVILGGHSAGCSMAVSAAWHLHKRGIPVDLLLCWDGASAFMGTKTVPPNVRLAISWRQDGWLGSARLCKGPGAVTRGDVCRQKSGATVIWEKTVPTDHFSIGTMFFDDARATISRGLR